MNDEEEAKARKLEEIKQKAEKKQALEVEKASAQLRLEAVLRQALSPEAKQRLSNVRLANRELYEKTAQAIAYLSGTGRLSERISEGALKELLQRINSKKEITIKRK